MNKVMKNTVSAILAASMLLPLTACGKKGVLGGLGGGNKTVGQEVQVDESAPYYKAEEFEINLQLDANKTVDYKSVDTPVYLGDALLSKYYVSYKMPNDVLQELYSLDYETDEGMARANEIYGEYNQSGLAMFDLQGNMIKTLDLPEGAGVDAVAKDKNGDTYAIVSEANNELCTNDLSLFKVNADGSFEKQSDIDMGKENIWVEHLFFADDGGLFLSSYGAIAYVDKSGKLKYKKDVDGLVDAFQCEGKTYAVMYDIDDSYRLTGIYMQEVNLADGSFIGEKQDIDWGASSNLTPTANGLYTTDGNGIQKLNLAENKSEQLLSWNDADFNYTGIIAGSINIISDEEIYLMRTVYEENGTEFTTHTFIIHLTKSDTNPHAGQKIITIGSYGPLNEKLVDNIVAYNRDTTHMAKINVTDLTSTIDWSDPEYEKTAAELADKIYLDLMAGTGPDILVDFSSFSQFNSENVLVDLNKYIDGDTGLNRSEYFDNIFRAFETKGKMYQIPVCCDIDGMLVNKSLAGERTGWTYDEFQQIAQSLPADTQMLANMTCNEIMETLLSNSMSTFVDYENKTVNFESEEFKKILELAKAYGTQEQNQNQGEPMMAMGDAGYDQEMSFDEGMVAAITCYVYTLGQYGDRIEKCKGQVEFVGFPSPTATGMSASPMLTMAISATSPSQDEAWDFIRFMFDHEQQEAFSRSFYSIPVSRVAFDNICKGEVEAYETRMKEIAGTDLEEKFTESPITMDMVDGYRALVENVNTMSSTDPAILMIVKEEAAAYFADQRSAEDVCKNIQNRTQTIVSERG